MRIRGIHDVGPVDNNRPPKRNSAVSESHTPASDKVAISDEARAFAMEEHILQAVHAASEVREDRVHQVKNRLETGYYDRADVLEQTTTQLMRALGF